NFPDKWKGQKVVGLFDFGRTQAGGLVGAETLLYIDGVPYKGVDQNHLEVIIKPELVTNQTEFSFRSWSGVPNQFRYDVHSNYSIRISNEGPIGAIHTVKQMNFGILDEKINSFYYDVLAILETVKAIKKTNSTESDMLLRALDKVYKFIDPTLEMLDVNAHIQQLYEAADLLKVEQSKIKKSSNVKFSAIAQTHIDVAWLWRIKHTREKIARSFSTALRLMDEYPDFIFLQSQPQLFAYLKKDYPTIFEEIKQKVKEGRFEVDGAMWLESDCNIPSGESLTRQILYGKMFMEDEFGVDSTFLWMPDVFGYSWSLPQILKKSGVDTFCTTKMGWNQYNRIPFNSFWWRGMDGTEMMTHLIEDTSFHEISADTMVNGWEKYKDKELVDGILYHFGLGDGGGGPQELNVELLHRYNDMPGLPYIEFEKAGSYFNRLNETASTTDEYVHTWDGEFYLELHRGTFTSQAFTKKYNRELEFKYRNTEILGSLTHIKNGNWDLYDQNKITDGWKLILLNQFHDIIPGSSIADVYVDALKDYKKAEQDILIQKDKFEGSLVNETSNKYSIFNHSNWYITDRVLIKDLGKEGSFYYEGTKLNSECIG
ncbi:MAG: alpha-mannosidase, partial [Turicibacter sp.]